MGRERSWIYIYICVCVCACVFAFVSCFHSLGGTPIMSSLQVSDICFLSDNLRFTTHVALSCASKTKDKLSEFIHVWTDCAWRLESSCLLKASLNGFDMLWHLLIERLESSDSGMTPLMYCIEPVFSVPSTAYVTLICAMRLAGGPRLIWTWCPFCSTMTCVFARLLPAAQVLSLRYAALKRAHAFLHSFVQVSACYQTLGCNSSNIYNLAA